MKLTWVDNGFICRDLYAPFVIEKDSEYIDDLRNKYRLVIRRAKDAGADAESLRILNKLKLRFSRMTRSHRKNMSVTWCRFWGWKK